MERVSNRSSPSPFGTVALSIQAAIDSTKNNLHDAFAVQSTTVGAAPGDCIHHIADPTTTLDQGIVQVSERLSRALFLAHLEELDSDLPWRRLQCIEFFGRVDDDTFRVVAGLAICDYDDIEWLYLLLASLLEVFEIGF